MGFNKILLPLDGTANAEIALHYAIQVANVGAHIHLLTVVDDNSLSELAVVDANGWDDAKLKALVLADGPNSELAKVMTRQQYLTEIAEQLKTAGFKPTLQIAVGYAVNVLPLIAHDGYELVVMASHGRTGLGRVIYGSVAEQVLHDAGCPVLIVPIPQP